MAFGYLRRERGGVSTSVVLWLQSGPVPAGLCLMLSQISFLRLPLGGSPRDVCPIAPKLMGWSLSAGSGFSRAPWWSQPLFCSSYYHKGLWISVQASCLLPGSAPGQRHLSSASLASASGGLWKFLNLKSGHRTAILKKYTENLLKHRLLGPLFSVWFSKSGVRFKIGI